MACSRGHGTCMFDYYFSSLLFLCVALGLIFLLLETSLCLSEGTIARQKPSEILKPPALDDSNKYDARFLPDRPLQLVRPDPSEHKRLIVVEENLKHLHHVTSAVAVVAVVGKYHSGKSFLLNQLMGKKNGFGVGPTLRPQTMGIWMWGKVCYHYGSSRIDVVYNNPLSH